MTSTPEEPWLRDAEQIGPFLKVCAISSPHGVDLIGVGCLVLMLIPVGMVALANATCAVVQPGFGALLDLLCVFAGATVLLWILAILVGIQYARKRLILGERGVAFWLLWRTTVVLFADLGTGWRSVPQPAHGYQPLALVLEHSDGRRVAITAEFEDHHQVALRVLEELARRTPERDQGLPAEGTTAIRPANRDITEPREEAP